MAEPRSMYWAHSMAEPALWLSPALLMASAPLHYGGAPYDGAVLWRHCTVVALYYDGAALWRAAPLRTLHYGGHVLWRRCTVVAPHYDGAALVAAVTMSAAVL